MRVDIGDFIDKTKAVQDLDGLRIVIDDLRDHLGLDHFAYLGASVPQSGLNDPVIICSYSEAWHDHYMARRYLDVDPVVSNGIKRPLPFEWKEFHAEHRDFFGEAAEFGVGANGLTVPVRGPAGDLALISASSGMPESRWGAHVEHFRHDIHVLGIYYHAAVVDQVTRARQEELPPLTTREVECLLWAAKGKTAWETSQILHISERTVIFHLNNAKNKLGVYSKHHAVVKAMLLGIVRP